MNFDKYFYCILTVPKYILMWHNFHSTPVSETGFLSGRLQNAVKLSCQNLNSRWLGVDWNSTTLILTPTASYQNRQLRHCWNDKHIEAGHNYHSYQKTYICQEYIRFFLAGHNMFISEQTYTIVRRSFFTKALDLLNSLEIWQFRMAIS